MRFTLHDLPFLASFSRSGTLVFINAGSEFTDSFIGIFDGSHLEVPWDAATAFTGIYSGTFYADDLSADHLQVDVKVEGGTQVSPTMESMVGALATESGSYALWTLEPASLQFSLTSGTLTNEVLESATLTTVFSSGTYFEGVLEPSQTLLSVHSGTYFEGVLDPASEAVAVSNGTLASPVLEPALTTLAVDSSGTYASGQVPDAGRNTPALSDATLYEAAILESSQGLISVSAGTLAPDTAEQAQGGVSAESGTHADPFLDAGSAWIAVSSGTLGLSATQEASWVLGAVSSGTLADGLAEWAGGSAQVGAGTMASDPGEPATQFQAVASGSLATEAQDAGLIQGGLYPQVGTVDHWLRENEWEALRLDAEVLGIGSYPYDLEVQTLSEVDPFSRSSWRLYTADRTVFSWPLFMGNSPFWYEPKRWTADDEGTLTCDQAPEPVDTADIVYITIDTTESTADQGRVFFDDTQGQPTTDSTLYDWSQGS